MIPDFSLIKITGFILVFVSSLLPLDLRSQSSNATLEREAETAMQAGNYRTALKIYRQGGFDHSTNKKALLNIGICLYEINDLDSAVKMFQWLINEGKTDADVFLYMGKTLQSKNNFTDAITYYKKFLEKTNPNHPSVLWAKDELTRCANGARLKFADEEAYVENAGASVNTLYSEFGVKNSPTIIEKIYFNSDRADDFGSADGESNNMDIYSAILINGKWTTPKELPANVNSPAYEEVCGFSADGQIIYYLTRIGNEFEIKTDTFSDQDGIVYQGIFRGPYEVDEGGTDLTFFNDTICLFSSNAPGGFGGYDLYVSLQHDGVWSKAENLGPTINSFYNERFPFLTRNGQTLFFSSDNLQSIGGYDVFRAVFDPEQLKWSLPQNLSFPVNSSLDDTYLILAPDGTSGYFTSNRKTGYGDNDVYMVFFKQPVLAHQQISATPTYYQILIENGRDQMTTDKPDQPVEIKEYFLSHLFLEENGEVLTPQNMKKLDLLANLLLIYPQIIAELSGFDLPTGQSTFNLYFSIKKVEKAVEYLERKGVPKSRLLQKGYGSSFPLVNNSAGMQNNAAFMKLNHRIEIGLHHFENEPVITHLENIPVPENLVDARGAKFSSLRHGLYYSIQIASVSQILQNTSLEAMSEIFIEVDNDKGNYRYMAGMLPTYGEAEKKLAEMIGLSFTDAFIVPYIDGLRVDREEISKFSIQYPDLLIFMEKAGK